MTELLWALLGTCTCCRRWCRASGCCTNTAHRRRVFDKTSFTYTRHPAGQHYHTVPDFPLCTWSGFRQRRSQSTRNSRHLILEMPKNPFKALCHSRRKWFGHHLRTLNGPFRRNSQGFPQVSLYHLQSRQYFVPIPSKSCTFHPGRGQLFIDSVYSSVEWHFFTHKHWQFHLQRANLLLGDQPHILNLLRNL